MLLRPTGRIALRISELAMQYPFLNFVSEGCLALLDEYSNPAGPMLEVVKYVLWDNDCASEYLATVSSNEAEFDDDLNVSELPMLDVFVELMVLKYIIAYATFPVPARSVADEIVTRINALPEFQNAKSFTLDDLEYHVRNVRNELLFG